jgi:hypothetical protein
LGFQTAAARYRNKISGYDKYLTEAAAFVSGRAALGPLRWGRAFAADDLVVELADHVFDALELSHAFLGGRVVLAYPAALDAILPG